MQNIIEEADKKEIENALFLVEDRLYAQCKHNENGTFWETMSTNKLQEVIWDKSETIYSGNAGIVIFYLSLYEYTKDKSYLDKAVSTASWIKHYCDLTPARNYAFYTGRLGVTYAFTELYKHTRDVQYIDYALNIAGQCEQFIAQRPNPIDDLINGTAGTLLGLVLLHSHTQNEDLLKTIERCADRLLNTFRVAKKGIYWDRSHHHINGLCGFSHGSAGVGY